MCQHIGGTQTRLSCWLLSLETEPNTVISEYRSQSLCRFLQLLFPPSISRAALPGFRQVTSLRNWNVQGPLLAWGQGQRETILFRQAKGIQRKWTLDRESEQLPKTHVSFATVDSYIQPSFGIGLSHSVYWSCFRALPFDTLVKNKFSGVPQFPSNVRRKNHIFGFWSTWVFAFLQGTVCLAAFDLKGNRRVM